VLGLWVERRVDGDLVADLDQRFDVWMECQRLIAGWLAGLIAKGTGFGLVADIAVGIVGALIGSWLLPQLGIHLGSGIVSAIIGATIGAIVLLLILRLFYRRDRWRLPLLVARGHVRERER
jgi:uncharacterized membrane protein YeaQ/YmgE (transglycosylase-associated protein family)